MWGIWGVIIGQLNHPFLLKNFPKAKNSFTPSFPPANIWGKVETFNIYYTVVIETEVLVLEICFARM